MEQFGHPGAALFPLTLSATLAPSYKLVLTLCLVDWCAIPVLSTIVCVSLTIVVDNEVILVQAVPDKLLVAFLIDFLV